jgi:hypothetical protein
VLAALWRYGENWLFEPGSPLPVALLDRESGRVVRPVVVDERTGARLDVREIRAGRAARS